MAPDVAITNIPVAVARIEVIFSCAVTQLTACHGSILLDPAAGYVLGQP